jgi:hypothetical protein
MYVTILLGVHVLFWMQEHASLRKEIDVSILAILGVVLIVLIVLAIL